MINIGITKYFTLNKDVLMTKFDEMIEELKKLADNYSENYRKQSLAFNAKLEKIKDVLDLIRDSKYIDYTKDSGDFLLWDGKDFYIGDSKEIKRYKIHINGLNDFPAQKFQYLDRLIDEFLQKIIINLKNS